ncbi:hypothetical protein CN503_21280 [Bacillus cereus]|nr:hypothetical protein CON43_21755 [Bacillus cereus]PER62651.1 hypothetical protein CN503_21280 [Bacillus cereus]PEY97588.1 hypothetical protein CN353_15565 [Bacillus cereus]PFU93632.1 hypothetical protein COL04_09195 [Bacillus cereus]PGU52590.1 hypothetical protein COD72_21060 [Bacillus cereus]
MAQNAFSKTQMWMVASGIQWSFGYLRYGKESGKIKTASLIDMVDNMLNLLMKMELIQLKVKGTIYS